MAVLAWLCAAGFYVGLTALLGGPVGRIVQFVVLPQFTTPLLAVLGASLWMLIRSPYWVRLSAAGVEVGTTRARAVLIPWSGVESATLRGWSVFANLDVVPHPVAMIALQDAKGDLPRMRTRGGRRGYRVQVGLFPGGSAAVTAALRARGIPEARLPAPTAGPR
ncbi:hypothetical protein [Dactylosporangium salmoneum]